MHLNNRKAIALTPVITKCFEKLVLHYNYIKTTLTPTFDSHQFVYREQIHRKCHCYSNSHDTKSHRTQGELWEDAFSTAVPYILIGWLQDIGLSMSIYICLIKDFLRSCPQKVKIEPHVVVLGLWTSILSFGMFCVCVSSWFVYVIVLVSMFLTSCFILIVPQLLCVVSSFVSSVQLDSFHLCLVFPSCLPSVCKSSVSLCSFLFPPFSCVPFSHVLM